MMNDEGAYVGRWVQDGGGGGGGCGREAQPPLDCSVCGVARSWEKEQDYQKKKKRHVAVKPDAMLHRRR